ncbi:MAG TPA: ATP-binding protein, partial [Myxococcaceae bacterium]|nr:ATP-binding protein [Myxococcaceae bacterium]
PPNTNAFGIQALVEQSQSLMLICDTSLRIRFVNFLQPGFTLADVLGRSAYDFVHPDDVERVRGCIQRALEHGETVGYETRPPDRFGSQWFAVRVGPIRACGEIIGLTMITTDISDLKRTQLRLEQSNRELESFAYVASHDLQEPLRKIQTFGERLKATSASSLGPTGLDYLERMHGAATRMRRLIDDLLSFSRLSSKSQPFSRVDLHQLAREVLEDLESTIEQAGATVTLVPLPSLQADPLQMRQLLQNLLSNALKFRRDDVVPTVSLRGTTDKKTGHCELVVEDNGIGFDEKYADRIFNVFQRLHGRNQYEGTGIGLAICRKIVERHGGAIGVRSAPGKGATFIVTLPLEQPTSS